MYLLKHISNLKSNSFKLNIKLFFTSIILLFMLNSCFDYEEIKFKGLEKFELLERQDDFVKIQLMMRIDNPNTYNVTLKKTNLDLYLNDKYVGNSTTDSKVKILKNKEGVYPVVMQVKGKDLLKTALGSMGSLLSGNIKLGAKGKVTGKAYGVSKTIDVAFSENLNLKDLKK